MTRFKALSAITVSLIVFSLFGIRFMANATCDICSDCALLYHEKDHDYWIDSRLNYYASTIHQYLIPTEEGYIRVCSDDYDSGYGVYVEYYDNSFQLLTKYKTNPELPIWGGFHATDDYFFVLTGQENPNESDSVETFRITKYDKGWNRLDSISIFGANTTVPFHAGSARFATSGDFTVIRTCHKMYKSYDGKNHQANATFIFNNKTMILSDQDTWVSNINTGYVSHSFNQFVKFEDNEMVAVDHGDAYPRSVVLYKGDYYDMFTIPGEKGLNYTGMTVGGLEISNTSYLVAGSAFNPYGYYLETMNIYISVLDKETKKVSIKWITDYEEGSPTASNPFIVNMGNNQFLLLWNREDTVNYVVLDENGNMITDIFSFHGFAKGCEPIVKDGNVVWYYSSRGMINFCQIPISNPKNAHTTSVDIAHKWETVGIQNNAVATIRCKKCGDISSADVPTNMEIQWYYVNPYRFWSDYKINGKETQSLYYDLWFSSEASYIDESFEAVNVTSSNTSIVRVDGENNRLLFIKAGTATVTFKSVYNPSLQKTFTFIIDHDTQQSKIKKATLTEDGAVISRCDLCGQTFSSPIARPKSFKLSKTKYTYTGLEQRPSVSIIDANGKEIGEQNYSVTYKNNVSFGKAAAIIAFRADYSGQKVLNFKIVPSKVRGVTVKSSAKNQAVFSFTKQDGAPAYQIYYSTEKDGTYTKLASTKKTSYKIKNLKSGKKYYFKVRAYKKVDGTYYYGAFSSVKKVKIK